jgi:peroxiredoxin
MNFELIDISSAHLRNHPSYQFSHPLSLFASIPLADVVGISGQDVESKQKFATELGLDFSILADEGDEVRKAFKVPKAAFGLFPGRVTYVLDKNGDCISVYDNLADAASHIDAAKDALEEVKGAAPANPFASFFNN